MRFPLKAVLVGLLIGAVLFLAPFGFPFFLFFFFIFFFSRFFFARRWGRWGYGPPWGYPSGDYYQNKITPIDGQRSTAAGGIKESEKKVTIH